LSTSMLFLFQVKTKTSRHLRILERIRPRTTKKLFLRTRVDREIVEHNFGIQSPLKFLELLELNNWN